MSLLSTIEAELADLKNRLITLFGAQHADAVNAHVTQSLGRLADHDDVTRAETGTVTGDPVPTTGTVGGTNVGAVSDPGPTVHPDGSPVTVYTDAQAQAHLEDAPQTEHSETEHPDSQS